MRVSRLVLVEVGVLFLFASAAVSVSGVAGNLGVLRAHAASPPLISCTATLAGANEVPPTASTGTGSITFTFDSSTSTSTWSETFSGLSSPATAAHIQAPAPPGSNAGVQVPFTGVPAATSGSFSGTSTTILTLTPAQFANALLAGNAYANIHTSTFPGGEIRGQLSCSQASSVPEFGQLYIVIALGVVAFFLIARYNAGKSGVQTTIPGTTLR